jgi:hypothetical protein
MRTERVCGAGQKLSFGVKSILCWTPNRDVDHQGHSVFVLKPRRRSTHFGTVDPSDAPRWTKYRFLKLSKVCASQKCHVLFHAQTATLRNFRFGAQTATSHEQHGFGTKTRRRPKPTCAGPLWCYHNIFLPEIQTFLAAILSVTPLSHRGKYGHWNGGAV